MKKTYFFAVFFAVFIFSPRVHAGTVVVPGASGGDFSFHVVSLKESRFKTTHRQQYDFSCGSATLATLLTYHYEDPVSEQEAFKAMFEAGDQEKIRRDGFSLLDIKNYLQRRGYQANGFRTSVDKLEQIGIPAIVLINQDGYRHFVLIKGVTPTDVLIGDPSRGVRRILRSEFESMWNGLFFLIQNRMGVARRHFNQASEWEVFTGAPLRRVLENHELAHITWLVRGGNDF